ncbi:MAG: hypothetical protein P1U32_00965 [Legionellaceae bacterium]|nr:hypothetical protein [Legionellaceae bacterium]
MLNSMTFDAFCAELEVDILQTTHDAIWEKHYKQIKDLEALVTSDETEGLTDIQKRDLRHLLGHAAWAVSAKLGAQGEAEALKLLDLASSSAVLPGLIIDWPVEVYLSYVRSVICLKSGRMIEANDAMKACFQGANIAKGHIPLPLKQHIYNQCALVFIKNGWMRKANIALNRLDTLSSTVVNLQKNPSYFDTADLIAAAEGDVELRTHRTKAYFHLQNESVDLALEHLEKVVDYIDPFKRPLDRAASLTLRAACFSSQKKSGEAYTDLKRAFGMYETCYSTPHIDALRTLIDLAVAAAKVERPNVLYLKAARVMQEKLGLKDEHPLSQALDAAPEKGTMADEHYRLACDMLQHQRLFLFTPYQNKACHVRALLYPLCFMAKALLSVARILYAAVQGSVRDMSFEAGALLVNVLNAVISLVALATRTFQTAFKLGYLANTPNLESAALKEKITHFETLQADTKAHQETLTLSA